MIDVWLCWCLGVILVLVGCLTAVYLISLQMRRGATSLSVLSTSDTVALAAVGIMFIVNGATPPHNFEEYLHLNETSPNYLRQVDEVLEEECNFGKILLGYSLFLAPFLNAFVSMLVHAIESYNEILKTDETSGAPLQVGSAEEDNISTMNHPVSIQEQRRKSSATSLGVPTLIAELKLVKRHLTEIEIESPTTSTTLVENFKPCKSKTIQDIDVFQVSNQSKQKTEKIQSIKKSTSDEKPNIFNIKRAKNDFKLEKRLGAGIIGQWLLPAIAVLILLASNMEEHNYDSESRIGDDQLCYVDNIASSLRISPQCLNQLRQESIIKKLISDKITPKDYSQIINHYALVQRRRTGEIDRMTSMIIKQIRSHVEKFNKTRHTEVDHDRSKRKRNRRQKTHKRYNITRIYQSPMFPVSTPDLRTLVKPNYDINITRPTSSVKKSGSANERDTAESENNDSKVYYDELPADYEDKEGDKEGSQGVSGEEGSEETTTEPTRTTRPRGRPTTKPMTTKSDSKNDESEVVYDEVVSDEEAEQAETQPGNKEKSTAKPSKVEHTTPTDVNSNENDNEAQENSVETTVQPLDNKESTPLTLFPQSIGLHLNFAKNESLGAYLIHNLEEFSFVKVCIKKCSISSNFLKGYLFAILFLGYFLPITAAVVIYIVIIKNVSILSNTSKPTETEEDLNTLTKTIDEPAKESCKDLVCISDIVKQFIILGVVLWSPIFLEVLLRTWFCVRVPGWVTSILFALGQVHGLVRNYFNVKLVKANTKSQTIKSLSSGIMRKKDGVVHPQRWPTLNSTLGLFTKTAKLDGSTSLTKH